MAKGSPKSGTGARIRIAGSDMKPEVKNVQVIRRGRLHQDGTPAPLPGKSGKR